MALKEMGGELVERRQCPWPSSGVVIVTTVTLVFRVTTGTNKRYRNQGHRRSLTPYRKWHVPEENPQKRKSANNTN